MQTSPPAPEVRPVTAKREPFASSSVSIIVPAFNAAGTLGQVLEALEVLPPDWEVIVVDDHSTDETALVAERLGRRVVRSNGWRSCSAARNTGVSAARGEYIVFLDSDIVASPAIIARAVRRLVETGAAGLFGVYDRGDHFPTLVSRFKNFWIRHSTLRAPRPLDWVNTSLTVVRRRDVEFVGGLDGALTTTRGGCDLDLGRRLAERCGPVVVDPTIEIRHLKTFSLRRLIANDFRRSRGWLRLALERRRLASAVRRWGLANIGPSFTTGVIVAGLGPLLLALSPLDPRLVIAGLATFVVHPAVNWRFLRDSAREGIRGWPLFPALLWLDQFICAVGIGVELASWLSTGRVLRAAPAPIRRHAVNPESR